MVSTSQQEGPGSNSQSDCQSFSEELAASPLCLHGLELQTEDSGQTLQSLSSFSSCRL